MILADTSAWVEFDRATGSAVDLRTVQLVDGDSELAVTEPVIMEVTAGARTSQREHDLRRLLGRFHLLPFEVPTDFDGATGVYRTCRRAGVTPRGLIDCMIAAVALRHGASLLQFDSDLAQVARVMHLPLDG
ncbi:MAG TPA: PIN domain nuclease [Acidimicrobiales bacterium]|nr:PIN domain nuclease [Acidimicrobiales bacterium]